MGSWVGKTGGGSGVECQCSITTLGEGPLLKSSHWGVAWKQRGRGAGDESVEAAGLGRGPQEGTGDRGRLGIGSGREINFGGSCVGTLGRPGVGVHVGWEAGGAHRRQDLQMSQRLAMASTWEILVGGAAPVGAPASTWRPWMIQSSVDGARTDR
jgi:hypothetical protein